MMSAFKLVPFTRATASACSANSSGSRTVVCFAMTSWGDAPDTTSIGVSDFHVLEKAWSISGPIFLDRPLFGAHKSCLLGDLGVGRFVPESPKPRVSSESDSAALATLQQGFCISTDRLVHNQSLIPR